MNADTITAIATAPGRGGIGIIRLSGSQALAIARSLFRPTAQNLRSPDAPYPPHRLIHGAALDPETGLPLDEALLAYMPAPRSYTREDVIELQLHGGPAILTVLLNRIIQRGARLAEPGEFTRRAFLNGRLDLTQAEAVADLIHAQSEAALALAVSQLQGTLAHRIAAILETLTGSLAELQAGIEFPDEIDGSIDLHLLRLTLEKQLLPALRQLADSYAQGRLLREGLRVAIAGRPNVGKSSLLNALLNQDRAIVTPVPGTTRDPIEAPASFGGFTLSITDTAGIHPSDDPVERIGIQKAHETLQAADLVLWVVEATAPFRLSEEAIARHTAHQPRVLVINKIDLAAPPLEFPAPDGFDPSQVARVSALTGAGIAELKALIVAHAAQGAAHPPENGIVTHQRHKTCLDQAIAAIEQAMATAGHPGAEELLCLDLQAAIHALNQLLGRGVDGDILDTIFQRFCIGK